MEERKLPSHLEIAYSSIRVFADDGTLDLGELNFLLGLALRDGVIDEEEKRVLGNILRRVPRSEVGHRVWERIEEIRRLHGIPV
jgi:hypothetical protein